MTLRYLSLIPKYAMKLPKIPSSKSIELKPLPINNCAISAMRQREQTSSTARRLFINGNWDFIISMTSIAAPKKCKNLSACCSPQRTHS